MFKIFKKLFDNEYRELYKFRTIADKIDALDEEMKGLSDKKLAGYTDIYTKSYGSRTKQNAAKVVIKALQQLKTVEKLASLRDVSVEHILKK